MKTYLEQLSVRMQDELRKEDRKTLPVHYYDKCLQIAHATMVDLKKYMQGYRFKDSEEEILYYKVLTPPFLANRMYFSAVYDLEVDRSRLRASAFQFLLDAELVQIDRYFEKYRWLYEYNLKGESRSDALLFTKDGLINEELDGSCCTTYSYQLAQILSLERYRAYIEAEIYQLSHKPVAGSKDPEPVGEWRGTKSDVAELIIGIQLTEVVYINGLPASIAQITELFGKLFGIELKDFRSLDYANRGRKKDSTPYLNSMIKKSTERSERLNG